MVGWPLGANPGPPDQICPASDLLSQPLEGWIWSLGGGSAIVVAYVVRMLLRDLRDLDDRHSHHCDST